MNAQQLAGLGRQWVPVGTPYPAVPRILPASPDDRWQGQGRIIEASAAGSFALQSALEVAIPGPAVVAVRPLDIKKDPPLSVGGVRVRALPPGGGQWERLKEVPPWGMALQVPGGVTTVDVALSAGSPRWSVTIAPGFGQSTALPLDPFETLPTAITATLFPADFAVKMRLFLFEGEISVGSPTAPTIQAPTVLEVPARIWSITGVAATNRVALQWEVFA